MDMYRDNETVISGAAWVLSTGIFLTFTTCSSSSTTEQERLRLQQEAYRIADTNADNILQQDEVHEIGAYLGFVGTKGEGTVLPFSKLEERVHTATATEYKQYIREMGQ